MKGLITSGPEAFFVSFPRWCWLFIDFLKNRTTTGIQTERTEHTWTSQASEQHTCFYHPPPLTIKATLPWGTKSTNMDDRPEVVTRQDATTEKNKQLHLGHPPPLHLYFYLPRVIKLCTRTWEVFSFKPLFFPNSPTWTFLKWGVDWISTSCEVPWAAGKCLNRPALQSTATSV